MRKRGSHPLREKNSAISRGSKGKSAPRLNGKKRLLGPRPCCQSLAKNKGEYFQNFVLPGARKHRTEKRRKGVNHWKRQGPLGAPMELRKPRALLKGGERTYRSKKNPQEKTSKG